MNIYKSIRNIALIALVGGGMTACDDFLEIKPTNDIVLEDYWTEKADVDAMVNTVYKSLMSDGCIGSMIVWGELRSDNVMMGKKNDDAGDFDNLKSIVNNNMYESNGFNSWSSFYSVINNCNIVLKYAPIVKEADPNFSDGDYDVIVSQMKAIRALCYFYLIRTFHAIPLHLTAVEDDEQVTKPYQTETRLEVFEQILKDLNEAEPLAVPSGTYLTDEENKGTITRDAINAILADVYLWMAAEFNDASYYQQCVAAADKVIDAKIAWDEKESVGQVSGSTANRITGKYPLAQNRAGSGSTTAYSCTAYQMIFGASENADESIFELQFDGANGDKTVNNRIYVWYGCTTVDQGELVPAAYHAEIESERVPSKISDKDLFSIYDLRQYEAIQTISDGTYAIAKYASYSVSQNVYSHRGGKDQCDANWILYRLTDVMLMKAEALVELSGVTTTAVALAEEGDKDESTETEDGEDTSEEETAYDEGMLLEAWDLAHSVWKRSNPEGVQKNDTLIYEDYKLQMEKLVMAERQRELMFEGKRWYDLMRYAYRKANRGEGGAKSMVSDYLVRKAENPAAVRSKLSNMDALFFPIAKSELDRNGNLEQNKEYLNTSSTERN